MYIDKMGSAILVVEDNGKQSIGQHSKEDYDRQNPSLWRKKGVFLNFDLPWKVSEKFTCDTKTLQKDIFPASSSSNLRLLQVASSNGSHSLLILSLAQHLAGEDLFCKYDQLQTPLKCSLQPVEEPPWLQSQPRHE